MPIRGEHYVGRLDIAMDNAFLAEHLDADNLEEMEWIKGKEYVGVDVHAPIPPHRDGRYPHLVSVIATSRSLDSLQP